MKVSVKLLTVFMPLSLLFLVPEAHAKRILFASQFSLIPEKDAHVVFGHESEAAINPKSIKVMVWNLKKGQEKGLDRDLPLYGKDRDLLLFSEGYLSEPVKAIFDSFSGIRWDMGVSFLYKKDKNTKTGTMIGSRYAPTYVRVRHTKDHEPIINTPKALTMAKYPIAGSNKELLVISIHGINLVSRAAFARHLAMAVDEIKSHDGPVIFGGDFNTQVRSKASLLIKTISSLGMQSLEFRNDKRNVVLGNHIDYTFVRGLYAKDAEVLGELKSSDHKAMLAELAVIE